MCDDQGKGRRGWCETIVRRAQRFIVGTAKDSSDFGRPQVGGPAGSRTAKGKARNSFGHRGRPVLKRRIPTAFAGKKVEQRRTAKKADTWGGLTANPRQRLRTVPLKSSRGITSKMGQPVSGGPYWRGTLNANVVPVGQEGKELPPERWQQEQKSCIRSTP